MITNNEKKVLRIILTSFDKKLSINQLAKEIGITPNGAYKILKKFEQKGFIEPKKIANIVTYDINFENEEAMKFLELSLVPTTEIKRVKARKEDFAPLKSATRACVVFGSYISSKQEPNDLDVLFILDQADFKKYKESLTGIKAIVPVKVHDIIQTEEDIKENIKKQHKIILNALRNGLILWGYAVIIKIIKEL